MRVAFRSGREGLLVELIGSRRDLLALCVLVAAGDRCDWGVIARQAHQEGSIKGLMVGEVNESSDWADQTRWVAQIASSDDWQAAYHRVDAEVEAARSVGAQLTTVLDQDFPINLRLVHNLPPFLFYRGVLDAQADTHSMAVVGTREATTEGLQRAYRMAGLLTESGITVVSGLARGIDTAAHQSTLDLGGRTIAVLGNGITQVSPRGNQGLAERIVRSGGLIVSQFLPTAHPVRWTFRKRNEVTSGISQGTVVIEASRTSGARLQARLASEHGKRVFLIKSLTSAQPWAHEMVEKGKAIEVRTAEEITERVVDYERLKNLSDHERRYLRPALL